MRIVILLVAVAVSACASVDNNKTSRLARGLGPGWECFKSPSDFFDPGTVFSLGDNGAYFIETELDIPVTSKRARLTTSLNERVYAPDFTAALLDRLNAELPLDFGLSSWSTEYSDAADIKVRQGVKRKGYARARQEAEAWVSARVLDGQTLGGREIFVVRSTFASGNFDYTLNPILGTNRHEAALVESADHNKEDRYILRMRKAQPVNLCMLVERIAHRWDDTEPLDRHSIELPVADKIVDRRQQPSSPL